MLYREMFDEVHAPQGLKEEVLNMTKQDTARVARKISAAFVIAAVLAVVLAGTALAAVAGVPQTLREWFDQQWTETAGSETMPKEQSAVERIQTGIERDTEMREVSGDLPFGDGALPFGQLAAADNAERKEEYNDDLNEDYRDEEYSYDDDDAPPEDDSLPF